MNRPTLHIEVLRRAPKVLLHDHLDGGLRPQTIIELAAEQGYNRLPSTDPGELGAWFRRGASQGSLELYLETKGVLVSTSPKPFNPFRL